MTIFLHACVKCSELPSNMYNDLLLNVLNFALNLNSREELNDNYLNKIFDYG